jgi:bisphosphoglycerate-dependent phosphoglycerate mutase
VAKGYSKFIEEDELEVLAQYHMEKFRNWMRPLDGKSPDSYITIKMPLCDK